MVTAVSLVPVATLAYLVIPVCLGFQESVAIPVNLASLVFLDTQASLDIVVSAASLVTVAQG